MKINVFLIVSSVFFLLTGCSYPHYFYSPNIQNVPLFTEKSEFSATIAGSLGVVNNSFELQSGLSLPAHLALTGNLMAGGNDNTSASIPDNSKIRYFEGSVGFYNAFSSIGVFEIYGGYGNGYQNHTFSSMEYSGQLIWTRIPDGTAYLSYSKLFIQPDIGIKTEWLDAAFSCRLSKLSFDDININSVVNHLDVLNTLEQNSPTWLVEPAFTVR